MANYIIKAERVFGEIRRVPGFVHPYTQKIDGVVETAKRYLEDAKYYQKKSKLETSLASVAYCEGLLDALRLLEVVEFSW